MAQYPANNFDIGISQNYPFKTAPNGNQCIRHHTQLSNPNYKTLLHSSQHTLDYPDSISHTPVSAPAGMLPADF